VIYGIGEGGQRKLLLVYQVDQTRILARHVTTQMKMEFDRQGNSRRTEEGSCRIVSTAALPTRDHAVTLGLDLKMRTGKEHPDFVLTKAEVDLLLTVDDFFNAHLLPED
jgi:hypothetical protein